MKNLLATAVVLFGFAGGANAQVAVGNLRVENNLKELTATASTARANIGLTPAGIAALLVGQDASLQLVTSRFAGSPIASSLQTRVSQMCNPVTEYGADQTGSVDSTTAIQACLATSKEVYLPAGTFSVTNIVIGAGQSIGGAGMKYTTLLAAANSCKDVVDTTNARALIGTNNPATVDNWYLHDLTINGNRANQACTGTFNADGMAIYSLGFLMQNVNIINSLNNGLHSDSYQFGGTTIGTQAGVIKNMTIDTSGQYGWWHSGPHDMGVDNLIVIDACQSANNTYDAIFEDNVGNGRYFNIHPWHRSTVTNRCRYMANLAGGDQVTSSNIEGGYSADLYLGSDSTQVANTSIYSLAPAAPAGSPLVLIAGQREVLTGDDFIGRAGLNEYGIQFGVTGGNTVGNQITGIFDNFDLNSPFHFVDDGGAQNIQGAGVAVVVTTCATSLGGSPSQSDHILYNQVGCTLNISPATSTIAQIADGTPANGNTRGLDATDFQQGRNQANQVASGQQASIVGGFANAVQSVDGFIGGGTGNAITVNSRAGTIPGGENNITQAAHSAIPGGFYGSDRSTTNKYVFASGTFSTVPGDAQEGVWLGRQRTAALTAVVLTSDGVNPPNGTFGLFDVDVLAPTIGSTFLVDQVSVVEMDTTNGSACAFTLSSATPALVTRGTTASTTAFVGSAPTLTAGPISGGMTCATPTLIVDTTLGAVEISVTPGSTDQTDIVGRIHTVEVQ